MRCAGKEEDDITKGSVPNEDGWCCRCRLCKYCNLICGVWKGGKTSKGRAVVSRPGTRVDGYSHHEQRS